MKNSINTPIKKFEIISCSRRTDIPAFLMDWVIKKIKQGFVDVVNPFNKKQTSRVSLNPDHVKCICWWSKDYSEWIEYYKKNKDLFTQYRGHYFQFTINSPSELELGIKISLDDRLKQLKWLIDEFGAIAVNYRYDPIIIYRKKNDNQIRANLGKFKYLMQKISDFGLKEIIFSFVTIYSKVKKRMIRRGFIPIQLSLDKKKDILEKLLNICNHYDLEMKACCQPDILELNLPRISQAHCIDAYKIEQITKCPISKKTDTGQRDDCGCYKSKDIGGYYGIFKCKHNCSYCYANPRSN
ncbi:MAG: hypothetical protein BAJALOKI1v1_260009 [Promethearchaeota archaeon]|nr:MAG: hypothetical protein BAJALOKI1v1_260009 [Candidatus Lokiarchaeota archaeon]